MVLAVRFATRTIKAYGLLKQKKGYISSPAHPQMSTHVPTHFFCYLWVYSFSFIFFPDMPDNSVKLHEMAFLLGVIRSIQGRITAKNQNSIRMVNNYSCFFTISLSSNGRTGLAQWRSTPHLCQEVLGSTRPLCIALCRGKACLV